MSLPLVPALFLAVAISIGVGGERAVAFAIAHPALGSVLVAVYFALRTAVTLAFAAFTLRRTEPHRHARSAGAFGACAVAMVTVVAFAGPTVRTPTGFVLAGDLVAVISCVWLLAAVLALGRCFGVLPEARGLVTRGPYRLVRHPVYLGEIGACAGLALAAPSVLNGVILMVFLGAQWVRMRLEERALTVAFGHDYERYAERTPRLIPRLVVRSRSRHARPESSFPVEPPPATQLPWHARPESAMAMVASGAKVAVRPPLSRPRQEAHGRRGTRM